MSHKTLLICIDGATFNLIDKYIEEGDLPNFEKVIKEGVRGKLKSTTPPVSCPAWPSLFTGENPGKHGVFDFFELDKKEKKVTTNSTMDVKAPFLWEILERNNVKSGVLNLPWISPLSEDLSFGATGQICLRDEKINLKNYNHEDFKYRSGKKPDKIARKTFDKFQEIMKSKDWDFLALGFYYTDTFQHKDWDSERVRKLWKVLDRKIGETIEKLEDVNVFIISDHGFGKNKGKFSNNRWLEKEGYLKEGRGSSKGRLSKIVFNLAKSRLSVLIRKLPDKIKNRLMEFYKMNVSSFLKGKVLDKIDWKNTQAYSIGDQGRIWINSEDKAEVNEITNDVIKKIQKLKGPSGEELDVNVFRNEEIYSGNFVDWGPDIVFSIENYKYRASGSLDKNVFNNPDYKGHHRKEGIFIAKGPDIKKGVNLENAEIYDIVPTVLHLFGLPIPKNGDGKVLDEIFAEESKVLEREVEQKDYREGSKKKTKKGFDKEEEDLKRRLEELGYLE